MQHNKLFCLCWILTYLPYINSQHNVLYYGLVKNNVSVTSCYELEMLDEHTASGSLFNLLICKRIVQSVGIIQSVGIVQSVGQVTEPLSGHF